MSLQLVFDWGWMPQLAQGLLLTMELTVVSLLLGGFLGLLLAVGRVYGGGFVSSLCSGYIQLFRGTPLLVQVMVIYFGLPSVGIYLSAFVSGLLALSLNTAAFQAEYFRGAIQSVPTEQMQAGIAVGLTRLQAIRYVILPQALRLVLPPWSNEVIYVLKASSVVYLVSLADLLGVGRVISSKTFRYFEILVVVALMYLAIVLIITFVLRGVERRVRIPGLGTTGFRD